MRLVDGVGIVMAQLVDNFLNFLVVAFERGIANDFFESVECESESASGS